MLTKPTKYTKEFVTGELDAMIDELNKNKDIIYEGELFSHRDYSIQRFSDWAEKFKDDEKIMESIKKIHGILEERINTGGLRKELNPIMCIFNLKNNYGWEDKTELAVSGLDQLLNEIHGKDEKIAKENKETEIVAGGNIERESKDKEVENKQSVLGEG